LLGKPVHSLLQLAKQKILYTPHIHIAQQAMDSTSNVFVICLIALFVWDKYNKGSEKAILENRDIQDLADLADNWGLWKTRGEESLKTLWNGDLCKKDPGLISNNKLRCWWHTGGSYFLLIGPLKKEEVSLFPKSVIFHDFISEKEVVRIQELSIPKLHPAGVGHGDSSTIDKGVRDAKHAWLYPKDLIVKGVERRTQEATGLNMMASEPLQVGRYGIGGHYKPHFDHDQYGTDDNEQGKWI
jgi:hypothetical protein